MASFLYNAPAGTKGEVSRAGESNVEPVLQGAQCVFGAPVKFDGSGNVVPIGSGDAATVIKGLLTRIAPAIAGNSNQGLDDSIPWLESLQGLLVRGYGIVKCTVGTPVRGGAVYVRVTADTGKLVGDLEASSDGANSVVWANVSWAVSGKDADSLTEIRILA